MRAFAKRLSARGKSKMTIVAAAMRKLLTLATAFSNLNAPLIPSTETLDK